MGTWGPPPCDGAWWWLVLTCKHEGVGLGCDVLVRQRVPILVLPRVNVVVNGQPVPRPPLFHGHHHLLGHLHLPMATSLQPGLPMATIISLGHHPMAIIPHSHQHPLGHLHLPMATSLQPGLPMATTIISLAITSHYSYHPMAILPDSHHHPLGHLHFSMVNTLWPTFCGCHHPLGRHHCTMATTLYPTFHDHDHPFGHHNALGHHCALDHNQILWPTFLMVITIPLATTTLL